MRESIERLAASILALDAEGRRRLFGILRGERQAPTRSAILAVCRLADRPLKGVVIAARIGKGYGGYLRGLLASMVRTGELVHVDGEGYRWTGPGREEA